LLILLSWPARRIPAKFNRNAIVDEEQNSVERGFLVMKKWAGYKFSG
jgi:hypothetical protein